MRRGIISVIIFVAFAAIFTLSRHSLTSSTTTTTTTSPSFASTTTTPVSVTTCQGSDFRGTFNQGEGAAGTILASVTLTKVTAGSCTVDGYPLLTLQDSSGAVFSSTTSDQSPVQFPVAAANQPATSHSVTDGGTISFALGYSDVPNGSETCPSAVTLNVQFSKGGSTTTVTPGYPLQPCNAATIWVSPFY